MTFFRHSKINNFYYIDNAVFYKVKAILGLFILLDHRINFQDSISMIVNKAYGVLGYVKRFSKEFVSSCLTKIFFISLVLEYSPIIGKPCYAVHTNCIEFLIFCLRGLGWNSYELPPYQSRLVLIKPPTLKDRRFMMGSLFILG